LRRDLKPKLSKCKYSIFKLIGRKTNYLTKRMKWKNSSNLLTNAEKRSKGTQKVKVNKLNQQLLVWTVLRVWLEVQLLLKLMELNPSLSIANQLCALCLEKIREVVLLTNHQHMVTIFMEVVYLFQLAMKKIHDNVGLNLNLALHQSWKMNNVN